jgi:hypothetical protein
MEHLDVAIRESPSVEPPPERDLALFSLSPVLASYLASLHRFGTGGPTGNPPGDAIDRREVERVRHRSRADDAPNRAGGGIPIRPSTDTDLVAAVNAGTRVLECNEPKAVFLEHEGVIGSPLPDS